MRNDFFCEEQLIPEKFRFQDEIICQTYLSGGQIKEWSGDFFEVWSPIPLIKNGELTRKKLGLIPLLGQEQAMAALHEARQAFSNGEGRWPSMMIEDRIEGVKKFIKRLENKKSCLSKIIMWEIAKPYSEVEDEIRRTTEFLRRLVQDARRLDRKTRRLSQEKTVKGFNLQAPAGVALCLGPFNYPLFETFSLIFPALIMGNTVVTKPPRFGLLFFHELIEDFRECFPAGTVNILSGDPQEVIEPIVRSGGIDVLAFIGSSAVARRLLRLYPDLNRLKFILGLEAKNAAVVLEDTDLDLAVKECLLGALAFNGQRCAALKIIFIHRRKSDEFLLRLTEALSRVKIGLPWEHDVRITPLADEKRLDYLSDLLNDAGQKGARVLNEGGGKIIGTIFSPALLFPVSPQMRIYHEEQFGPIIPVVPFESLSEPVEYIRNSDYGQQVSILGSDEEMIKNFIRAVRTSVARVNVNVKCQRGPEIFPFTARKGSGLGDFSSPAILEFFSEKLTVTARVSEYNLKKLLKD